MKLFSVLVILVGMFCLSACGPVYKTDYQYVPPKSNNGKLCAVQCTESKAYCKQACNARKSQCLSLARREAMHQYRLYKDQQLEYGKPVKKSPSDFEYSSQCEQSCGCNDMFNLCYQTCGGVIKENKVCVAFCDK